MINLSTFIFGFSLFLGLVVFQLLWWRLRRRFMVAWMFATFLFIPLIFLLVTEDRAAAILLLALSLSYLFGFPAVVARSPSLEILKLIHRRTPQGGISQEEILKTLAKEDLIEDRMNDLASDGMIFRENGKIKMRLFGKMVGMTFYYYRKLLGLPAGTG